MPRRRTPPARPLPIASAGRLGQEALTAAGSTWKKVMIPSWNEWMPTAMRKATAPASVTARPRRQAASQMTAPRTR